MRKIELTGKQFGRLYVLRLSNVKVRHALRWSCVCDCGEIYLADGMSLRLGHTKSCGCLRRESSTRRATKHGGAGTKLYMSWQAMRNRCSDPKSADYYLYGGRGIKVCERWNSSFANFRDDMGERPTGKTLDRINNDGNYEPGNCRWATALQQSMNKRKSTVKRILTEVHKQNISKALKGRKCSEQHKTNMRKPKRKKV